MSYDTADDIESVMNRLHEIKRRDGVQNHAAAEEIEEALDHLAAAMVDQVEAAEEEAADAT